MSRDQTQHDPISEAKAKLRSAVEAELMGPSDAEPGKVRGKGLDAFKKGLAAFDSLLDKYAPVAVGLTPAQFKALVIAIASTVDALNGAIN